VNPSAETSVAVAVARAPHASSRPALKVAETESELAAYHALRREVFVGEQGLFEGDDLDEKDARAIPIIATVDGRVVGVVRCYRRVKGVWYGGRLAVARDHRTGFLGARLVRRAVAEMEARPDVERFYATVQIQNVAFFERLGWTCRGRSFVLEGVEHRFMEYPLRRNHP